MTNPEFSDDPRGGSYIDDGEKIVRVEDEHTTPEEKGTLAEQSWTPFADTRFARPVPGTKSALEELNNG